MNYLLAPSILSMDFAGASQQLRAIEDAGADWVHFDVMDGRFVPQISFGTPVLSSLKKTSKLPFDVHLMIEEPEKHIQSFIDAGADRITIHAESTHHLDRALNMVKDAGLPAGVAVNPATPVERIYWALGLVDMILIMTVNPGYGGQSFIPYCYDKISQVRDMLDEHNHDVDIQIDGGATRDNISDIINAGANVVVAGSSIFKGDIADNVRFFKNKMSMGENR
mgnify:CR=1 FL=1